MAVLNPSATNIPGGSREFTVKDAWQYNRSSPIRWLFSHIMRHRLLLFLMIGCSVIGYSIYGAWPVFFGQAVDAVTTKQPDLANTLLTLSLLIMACLVGEGLTGLIGFLSIETIAQRLEADCREELYRELLGKSQTFHDQQRVGDIMARATDDVRELNGMMNPGVTFIIYDITLGFSVPILYIGLTKSALLAVPLIFIASYFVVAFWHIRRLNPINRREREQFGKMNAGLEESITGIEVVKASAQEVFERRKFRQNARLFRNFFVRRGLIEAQYPQFLVYGVMFGLFFLHCISLYQDNQLTIAQFVTVMGLFTILRFPVFVSLFAFTLLSTGVASAERLLNIIKKETDLDENESGKVGDVDGAIAFDNVTFGYDANNPILKNLSFDIKPGQTVAIVGQTGSGKSTLTQLVNRSYDVNFGRVLIDGVDVRDWNLDSLRSQISKIEQDIFLFSRTIAENIAFGAPNAKQEDIERAAREAQAHDFIMSFSEGYQTKVGERGVTLSGGQRQRIALARAFLGNPRILILDDSTSAIDSATEDEIQRAIRRAQEGRTTLLITHRLSQIRWADRILVIEGGEMVASGTHDELLRRSVHYRRIFARFDVDLPELETA